MQRGRPLAKSGLKPRPGARFPSQVLGENVRDLRLMRDLKQEDLSERMNKLGHTSWSRVTVSDVERAQRSVGVDELFALALALETTVVKLLDPWGVAGQRRGGVDLGLESGLTGPHEARAYILTADNPFGLQPDIGITWEGNTPQTMRVRRTEDVNYNLDLFSDRAKRLMRRFEEAQRYLEESDES